MGHNLEQLGTATLDTMGGLVTNCNPQDLPEGASPRCYDVDFIIGSVFTRPGLQNVYSFSGESVGPNVCNLATDVPVVGSDSSWVNTAGIEGTTSYASVSLGTLNSKQLPNNLTQSGASVWSNLPELIQIGPHIGTSTTLTVPRGVFSYTGVINCTAFKYNVPAGPVVGVSLSVGVEGIGTTVSTSGLGSVVTDTCSLTAQLVSNGLYIGAPITLLPNTPVPPNSVVYTLGGSNNTWGVAGLTSTTVNNSTFGVDLYCVMHNLVGSTKTRTITANALTLTVYYQGAASDELWAQSFTYAIPPTAGINGIGAEFNAFSNPPTVVTIQLIKNGVPVGTPKTQVLTTTPTNYSLGSATDSWGTTWLYSDLNNNRFGLSISAANAGITSIQNVRTTAYITTSLVNFNYVKSYIQNSGQTYTLALDANGIVWQEDVTNNPKVLSTVLTGIIPGSFAKSATLDNREHILFSNLTIGTDRPRVYNGSDFNPLSKIGPGAPPAFVSSVGTGTGNLSVTHYSLTSDVVAFTITAVATAPVVGSLYTINNVVSYLNGNSYTVLATPAPTTTSFSVGVTHADDAGGSVTGTATPAYSYGISTITQPAPVSFNGQELIWSAPGAFETPGNVLTMFYGGTMPAVEDPGILAAVATGNAVYLYIKGAPIGNGTWLMTGHGLANAPHESGGQLPFISITYTSSGNARYGGPSGSGPNGPGNFGSFQQTLATVTTATAVPGVSSGDLITTAGVTPTGWNSNWTIVDSLNSMTLNITSTAMSTIGVATYGWSIETALPGVTAPQVGQIVLIINCANAEIFNTTGVIQSVTGSFFEVDGFTGQPVGGIAQEPEFTASATTFGTQFTFDPGSLVQPGASTTSIFGTGSGGTMTIVGGVIQPIGAGIRQGVCFFITENGYESPMSPPVIFTTSSDANFILASQIPIGPPDTVARGISFTEAGQNGVPGANFYVIEDPVTITVWNTTTTYTSTIIHDNVSTTAKFSFTDAVLLNSREVDVQGDNLFNLIELGSSGWCVPYHTRMFYGLQLNKINNWTTGGGLTFDQGYLPNPGGNIQPLGWTITDPTQQTLLKSTVTGNSLYIFNSSVSQTVSALGLISQTAFQDPYQVPIIEANTTYSVRVAASAPSGLTTGTLVVDLFTPAIPQPLGSFAVPLSSMSSNISVFTGTLLTTPFTTAVPSGLIIRVYVKNAGPLVDCEIDRIEVFPTKVPYLTAQVYGSYPGQPEAIDASSTGGIIDTTSQNSQACMGGFVMRDLLFLLKTSSMYSTEDNPNSEPGGWGLHEVSNLVGTIGISSYDVGEEWMVTACSAGIFGFNGGQPTKISQEIWNLWECINWNAGNAIVLRNDIVSKRMYIAIPLPTGTNPVTGVALPSTKWLPNAPYNPKPTTPNVMLMMNYQGLATFEEMIVSPEVHTTMFGTLAAPDMKRKWTIWNISTPAMEFIIQPDGETQPLYICNGINSSKIYQLESTQLSDDGVAINSLYTSYGFVNAAKAATLPIFGFHAKRYTVFQCAMTGGQTTVSKATNATIRMLPNTISPKYPYTVPVGIPLTDPVQDDFFRPINVKGNRIFVEVSTNAVGSWFNLSKILLTGKADPFSTLNPTGGGNAGIV